MVLHTKYTTRRLNGANVRGQVAALPPMVPRVVPPLELTLRVESYAPLGLLWDEAAPPVG